VSFKTDFGEILILWKYFKWFWSLVLILWLRNDIQNSDIWG